MRRFWPYFHPVLQARPVSFTCGCCCAPPCVVLPRVWWLCSWCMCGMQSRCAGCLYSHLQLSRCSSRCRPPAAHVPQKVMVLRNGYAGFEPSSAGRAQLLRMA